MRGLNLRLRRKSSAQVEAQPVSVVELEGFNVIDEYWIYEPYAKVKIVGDLRTGGFSYFIDEVQLNDWERRVLERIVDVLSWELEPPSEGVVSRDYVVSEARRVIKRYGFKADRFFGKILYYVERDFLGFGPLDPLMRDSMIEDISVNGVGLPIYIWHRRYESMPTNIVFNDQLFLDNLVLKLAHFARKHVSVAFPILDAMLPGQHRLAATFKAEVSPKGSSFTIRKFRAEPFSITELIELGTLDEFIASYLWFMIDNRATLMIIGGTGSGKTSFLNSVVSLIQPHLKIVTVEEIPELQLPRTNWVQLVSRESYGLGASRIGSVSLFDLVKVSLRYRPDYIIIGEVRGEEAFVLFQAMATGHGGMCTMHAENLSYAIKRLTGPPMNVSPVYIPLMNIVVQVERVRLPKPSGPTKFGRRVRHVWEIAAYEDYLEVFSWNPIHDVFNAANLGGSCILRNISVKTGVPIEELIDELERRRSFLKLLIQKGVRRNEDVVREILRYHVEIGGGRWLRV